MKLLWLIKYYIKKYGISMKKETKKELFWIILMILFLLAFFLTGCKNYYVVAPGKMEMFEIRNRFIGQFEEADSVFNVVYKNQ